MFIGFNQAKPLLKDVRVRQALNYAVNWEAINKALYQGKAPRMATWVADQSVNVNKDLKAYAYDPAKAKSLLQEAGVPDGTKMIMDASNGVPEFSLVAQAVAADYGKIGLQTEVQSMEGSLLVKKLTSKEVDDLWLISYGGGSDDGQGALTTLQKDFVLSAYNWDNPELGTAVFDAQRPCRSRQCTASFDHDEASADRGRGSTGGLSVQVPKAYAYGKRVKAWQPRFDQLFMPWEVTLA